MNFSRRHFVAASTLGAFPLLSQMIGSSSASAAPKKSAEKVTLVEAQQEALGAFIVGFLFSANSTVGLLVDATEGETQEVEAATKSLAMTAGLIQANKEVVQKLSQYDEVGDEDKKFFIDLLSLFKAITEQAAAAEAYWKSEDEADLKKFTKLRKSCDAKIDKLFSQK